MTDDGILRPGAVALIAGASAGIGAAKARALAETGARVICASRDKARLDELVARLGDGAYALELDVADPASAASLVERLPEGLRAIDILVACAGHDTGGGSASTWAGSRTGPASSRPT